mmetsp:Transcript_19704/g.49931  ORF Transcript_19704/g.49931 Transcript_19704/m.49931 type:complete len:226 (+) Transcript_19704:682-1359(+)
MVPACTCSPTGTSTWGSSGRTASTAKECLPGLMGQSMRETLPMTSPRDMESRFSSTGMCTMACGSEDTLTERAHTNMPTERRMRDRTLRTLSTAMVTTPGPAERSTTESLQMDVETALARTYLMTGRCTRESGGTVNGTGRGSTSGPAAWRIRACGRTTTCTESARTGTPRGLSPCCSFATASPSSLLPWPSIWKTIPTCLMRHHLRTATPGTARSTPTLRRRGT